MKPATINSLIEEQKRNARMDAYKNLWIWNGGMRAKFGVGSNRMNKYTVERQRRAW
jgi:hypothetical protein